MSDYDYDYEEDEYDYSDDGDGWDDDDDDDKMDVDWNPPAVENPNAAPMMSGKGNFFISIFPPWSNLTRKCI